MIFKFKIVFIGRYELDDVILFCEACNCEVLEDGFWPGSVERHSQYLFNEDVFLFFDLLCKFSPGLSTRSFLNALEQFSASKCRVSICACVHIYICLGLMR